jgi:phosphatidylglycerol---prolipoprotein diacylglyceryl transferase
MVACAMLAAFFMLRADLTRRGFTASSDKPPRKPPAKVRTKSAAKVSRESTSGLTQKGVSESRSQPSQHSANAEAEMLIAVPCLAGIVGAKLYHVLETPATFFAHPLQELFSPYGFAWFGGLLAGFAAFVWVGRRQNIPLLTLLDAGSPAAALGYGIGRIGCLLSGDGDYGIPTSLPWGMSFPDGLVPTTQRVHPTPIYELIVACLIAWVLWRMGHLQILRGAFERVLPEAKAAGGTVRVPISDRASYHASPESVTMLSGWLQPGSVFATYLVLTGAARFLVEFIRINPRSFLGMSNAQAAGLACVIAGVILRLWLAKKDLNIPA